MLMTIKVNLNKVLIFCALLICLLVGWIQFQSWRIYDLKIKNVKLEKDLAYKTTELNEIKTIKNFSGPAGVTAKK